MSKLRVRGPFARVLAVLLAAAVLALGIRLRGLLADPDDPTRPVAASTALPRERPSQPSGATSPPTKEGPLDVYAATLPGKFSPAVAGDPELVYVPNSESSSVDVIDPATFRIVDHFAVGAYPQHITPSWDLRWLYVDNTTGNFLTVIDPRTGKPTGRKIPVADPYNLYFTPDGSKAIVVAERFQRLDFRDPRSWKLIKSVPIPSSGPDHLDFSADGSYLLISTELSGYVYRVDTRSMRVRGRANVGGLPIDVKLSPDGSVFFVTNQGSGGVSVIDPIRMRQVAFIPTGKGAHGLAISRDTTKLYVSNRLAGTISVLSFVTRQVVAMWSVGGSPDMLQVSPDGHQLWASNRFNGSVSVIDTDTGKVLHVIRVGASPHGLAFFPQPGLHSLGHNGVYR